MDPNVKFCPNCGTRLPIDAMFCEECGERQDVGNVQQPGYPYTGGQGYQYQGGVAAQPIPTPKEKTAEEIAEEERKKKYQELVDKLQKDTTIEDCELSILRLKKLGEYEDAPALLEQAEKKLKSLRYQEAEAEFEKAEAKPSLYCKLVKEYEELGDYRNSKERYQVCKEKADVIKAGNKKKGLIIGAVVLAVIIIAVVLFFVIKTDAAKQADAMIADIGEVTLESGEQIEQAEAAVAALSDREVRQLDNEEILTEARQTYDQLVTEDNISKLEAKIDGIGTVTLKKKSKIEDAREAYDGAPEEVKQGISNYKVLTKAEDKLKELRAERVEKKISAIGTVTLNSKKKIEKARDAYDKLSNEEADKVSNYSVLTKAEKKYDKLKKADQERKDKAAIAKLRTKYDKVEGITWYEHPRQPYYTNTRTFSLPYIGKNGSSVWLRWKFNYTGDDWIFFETIKIVVDGDTYTKNFNYYDVDRDNGYGDVWEVADIAPDDDDIALLKKISKSKETIIRFQGDNYHYDLTISSADKRAIKQVLRAYNALK